MTMAGDALQVIRLRNDFYRDGFHKVLLALGMILFAIILLVATSLYLFLAKPPPVNFASDNEWRIVPAVPLNQPYLKTADLIQWVSTVLPDVFTYDFINYKNQLNANAPNFTDAGWSKLLGVLNNYEGYTAVVNAKLFVNGSAGGAPFILNQGLLSGKYGWWVQMPINLGYSSYERNYTQPITLQILVVRIPTLNNLYGVAIDNIVVVSNNRPSLGG
ncbi:MAG TPA: DotI/IcmL/TraM family protein [Gammaproteobacteria bacterium]|nr:DotI/IcmL/TraM family protein [Gammaproteobacteria bacterium]